jgi:uncharacterized protein GlcG (DUF336 family)
MTAITLAQANRIIDAIFKRGAELQCRPLSVIVVEPGCKVKAFQKEDGSSMIRFEMAYGKAYAALALGRSSKLVRLRAEEKPIFMRYLIDASDRQIFPEDRDEELAAHGIRAAGLKTDADFAHLDPRSGVRLG